MQGHYLYRCPTLDFLEIRVAEGVSACYHSHSHDEFSLGVIDSGKASYKNQASNQQIYAQSLVTINPGDVHSCNPSKGDWSYRMLFIDSDWVGQWQREMTGLSADYLPFAGPHMSGQYQAFNQLFLALAESPSQAHSEALLGEYLAGLFQHYQQHLEATADRPLLQRVEQLLSDQLASNLTLESMAEQVDLNRFQLLRSFKKVYGQTPHAYQLDLRIKAAKQRLKQGQALAEVALDLGFSDQSHFQRNFKKRVAITPGQYQQFFL